MYDIHCHILPGMDDGAKDEEMSIKMLEMLRDDRVEAVVLTPHFYSQKETVESFLERREESFARLQKAIGDRTDLPKLLLGAEVYFTSKLEEIDLTKICYGDSRIMLLELPFGGFSKVHYDNFSNFLLKCPVDIVLAHIERYFDTNKPDELLQFAIGNHALTHVSCSSFFDGSFFAKQKVLKYAKLGAFAMMGTDSHNITDRKPEFGKAESFLRKKIGNQAVDEMFDLTGKIIECAY